MFEKKFPSLSAGLWSVLGAFPSLRTMIAPGLNGSELCGYLTGSDEDILCRLCVAYFFSRGSLNSPARVGQISLSASTLTLNPYDGRICYARLSSDGRSWSFSVGYRDGLARLPKSTREALIGDGWVPIGREASEDLPVVAGENFYEELYRTASSTGKDCTTGMRIP